MKQKILYIILMIIALVGGKGEVWAWGENTSYVYYNVSQQYELNTIDNGPAFELSGPGSKIIFDAAKSYGFLGNNAVGAFYAQGSKDGEQWSDISGKLGLTYPDFKTYEYNISSDIKFIRFVTKTGATYTKYYKNIKVTRATTLSTTTTSLAFGSIAVNASSTKKAYISYNNTTYPQQLTGTCTNDYFTVTPISLNETGDKIEVEVVYSPKAPGNHSGTVTLSMNNKTVTFTVTGTALATYNFSASASPNNANYGSASASVSDASITTSETSATTTATFTATAKDGYEFVGWATTQGATSYESTANPYQTNISNSTHASMATKSLYAIFRPVFRFLASAEKIYDYGTVSASVADKLLGEPSATSLSAQATFTATANAGCTFEGWYSDREHTKLVSKDANYKPTITNNTIGSTEDLTLYAWFKCNQTISWVNEIEDFNLIQGTTVDCSAKSNKGLTVRYKSSNDGVASVDENGVVTANAPSNEQVVITAYQEGNDEFNAAAEITRAFYVLQKLQPVFEVSGFSGVSPTLKVEDTPSITLSNVDADFTFSSSDNTVVSIARNGDVLTLTALKAGTAKVILSQPANNTHNAASAEYNITVERYQGGLSVSLPEAMKVGETVVDFWNTNNNEVSVVVESSNPNVLTYTDGTLSAVGEGTAVITVSQAENNKWAGESRQQTITVSKVTNTLGISLESLETKVGNGITVSLLNQNNTETPVIATITDQVLSSEVNEGTDVISYADGIIIAKNAGTAKITFSQSASTKYDAFTSSTYEITVTKNPNPIIVTLNGGNALNINLKYGATASVAYTSANADTQCLVSRTSGSCTTLSGNTITAGNSAGTDIYVVTQAETHKYEPGYAMFSIRVNNTDEELGYVLYDETEYKHGTGAGVVHTYELSGPGEILYYSADRDGGAIYYNLYVEYSPNNSDWYEAQNNTDVSTSYKDFSCAIPETARYVRFRFPSGGTLTKYIKNVKVPRKTYVRASSERTDLGTVLTGTTSHVSFTVDYSTTNGGNIHVNSSNPNFVVSESELSVDNHSDGTKTFTVTYTPNPEQLGEESALITVSDLFYTQEITLQAIAAKQDNTLKVVGDQDLKVGDIVDNVYTDKNSDAELTVSISSEGVVDFEATSNRLTAIGEGSAVVTIFQNANDSYHGITKTINVNVSKNENTLVMSIDKNDLKVGEYTIVNFNDLNSDGVVSISYSVEGIVEFCDGYINALKAGTTRITITQAATVAYTSVSQSFDITVTKHDQTIKWDNNISEEDANLAIGQTLDINTATASSGLPVVYSSSNPAALNVDPTTGKLTAISSGVNILITATQPGNEMYSEVSITRSFNVISKMEATIVTSLSSSETNVLRIGDSGVTIGCTTPISVENFTIEGDADVVTTTFENNVLTITPNQKGEVLVTLAKPEDESCYAINQTYRIHVIGPSVILDTNEAPEFLFQEYDEIILNRSFTKGYSTLTLPFNTNIAQLINKDFSDLSDENKPFVAQLEIVTYNNNDNYTLFFKKVAEGDILANEPYVVYLPVSDDIKDEFTWSNITIAEINPLTKSSNRFHGWTMQANYTPGVSMVGNYGIAGGKLCLGAANSTINAYTAYFVPPTANARVRMAVLDDDGGVTYIDDIRADGEDVSDSEQIYRLDGTRQTTLTKGINIVKMANGEVRRVLK